MRGTELRAEETEMRRVLRGFRATPSAAKTSDARMSGFIPVSAIPARGERTGSRSIKRAVLATTDDCRFARACGCVALHKDGGGAGGGTAAGMSSDEDDEPRKKPAPRVVDGPDREKEAHYWAAVYEGDADFIRLYLLGDEDNEPEPGITLELEDARGLPTLHRLAVIGHQAALHLILADAGANVNQRESAYGQTALHLAAIKGHVDIVELLISFGADIDARDAVGGWTALHGAARAGQDDVIQFLLDRAPTGFVDVRAARGDTPLMRAAYWGRVSSVRLLLARGASRTLTNDDGDDANALACRGPCADLLGLGHIRVDLLRPPNETYEAYLPAGSGVEAGGKVESLS